MHRTLIIRREYLHFIPKYSRYEKRHKNLAAHVSPAFRVEDGDQVTVGQCRPLSKTVRPTSGGYARCVFSNFPASISCKIHGKLLTTADRFASTSSACFPALARPSRSSTSSKQLNRVAFLHGTKGLGYVKKGACSLSWVDQKSCTTTRCHCPNSFAIGNGGISRVLMQALLR